MKISYEDAIVPAAAAIAVAIRRNPARPLCTIGTLAAGQMATDHLRRDQPKGASMGIYFSEGDIPGVKGRQLDLVNSGANGLALGLAWLVPTMLFRKLPKAVGPAVGGLTLLAARAGARAWAESASRKAQEFAAGTRGAAGGAKKLGDLGLKDASAKGGSCGCGGHGNGGCGCGGQGHGQGHGGCGCGGHGGGHGRGQGGCGCGGHGGHGHGHHGHPHHGGHGNAPADSEQARSANAPGDGEHSDAQSKTDALAETVAGQTTSPISGRSTMNPAS